MLFGLLGKKSGESERPAKHRESARNRPDAAPIVNTSPADKSAEAEQIDEKRRQLTQGILALIGAATLGKVLPGCTTYEDYTKRFKNNFDYCPDKQFTEEDLETANSRNKVKMNAEDCRWIFQKAMDEQLSDRIDLDDIFYLHDSEGLVTATNKILSPESQQALMKKYPFIQSIKEVESLTYIFNYEFTTDHGYLYFSVNKSRVVVNDFGLGCSIGMLYNTSDPYVQTSPEYRDYQRRVTVSGQNKQGGKYLRELTCETGHGVLEHQGLRVQAFSSDQFPREHIYETETFTEFLRNTQSTPVVDSFLKNVKEQNELLQEEKNGVPPAPSESAFSLTNIEKIDQLIEIFRLLPADPKMYGLLLRSCLQYKLYDRTVKDEFRNPVTTLRSGWADCDDFAVINYFWAFLHRFNPNMTVITNNRNNSHHVFIWYRDDQDRFVVMDNNDTLELDSSYDVEKYLQDFSSNYQGAKKGDSYTINYNDPV